jgi:hypothetical protein
MAQAIAAIAGDLNIYHGIGADLFDSLGGEAQVAQNLRDFVSGFIDIHILAQPIQRYLHFIPPSKTAGNAKKREVQVWQ